MCLPLITVAAIATVASAGIGAYGSIQSGKTQAEIANYQSGIDRNNAIIADQNAKTAREKGSREEASHRLRVEKMIGQQRASMGANGIELDSGSALDVQMDTAQMGELDALMIRHNAELNALSLEQKAENFRSQAVVTKAGGQAAKTAGFLGAAGKLTGGIGKAFEIYGNKPAPKPQTASG